MKKAVFKMLFLLVLGSAFMSCATGGAAVAGLGVLDGMDEASSAIVVDRFERAQQVLEYCEKPVKSVAGDAVMADGAVLQPVLLKDESPAYIVLSSLDAWTAYPVTGVFAEAYADGGYSTYGAPLTYEFLDDGFPTQVFEKGVMVVEAGTADWVAEPAEMPAELAGVGELRGDDEVLSALDDETRSNITSAVKEAYKLARLQGFNPGKPAGGDKVHQWDGPLSQNFSDGDSISGAWGINSLAIVFLYPESKDAFFVRDEFVNKMEIGEGIDAHSGAFGYGGALSPEYIIDGKVCQRFGKGIMQREDDGSVSFIPLM
ncbi:MAG: hypothetical protein JXR86_18030 [Spirochaetales bacterium]|nr:hypothetical protein [Spirochaetales bacterium]